MKCKTCGSEVPEEPKETIKIPELKIEIETKIHDKGKILKDVNIPKGWRLLTVSEVIFLSNNQKYRKLLNMVDTWEFIEQPFDFNRSKQYVAGFNADSDRAGLYCNWNPRYSDPSLGVRFVRDKRRSF